MLVFIIGLFIGSFLNVVIYRVPREESIVWPGSHCTACGHGLKPLDLVPVFSYLFLRGKCHYCGEKISPRYPLVELLTGLSFYMVFLTYGLSLWTVGGCIFTTILIVTAFTDIDEGIIPDVITYPGVVAGLVFSFFTIGIKSSIIGMLAFAGVFFLIAVLSRGGMGGGDVKLVAVIGAFMGIKGALLVFVLSSVMGGLWAIGLLVFGNAGRKTAVRFGPFLSIAAYFILLYGESFLRFYLGLFY
ncbi:MAG: prepilin peptidase [Bacillota bacterium]|nr:prepilin peptidase [Bacillota bacterium]